MKKDISTSDIFDIIGEMLQPVGKVLLIGLDVIAFLLKAITVICILYMFYDAPERMFPALFFILFIWSFFYAIKDITIWDLGWFILFLIIISIIF